MDCEKYVNLMSRYVDGDLSDAENTHWSEHFDNCENCKTFFNSFKSSLELVDYLKDKPCPVDVAQRLNKLMQLQLTDKTK